jgi:hypothetical protein
MKQEQITEWTENPVTELLLSLISKELKETEDTSTIDCYVPGSPEQSQENLADLAARYNVWSIVEELLGGDWSYFMEEEDEPDGDHPFRE